MPSDERPTILLTICDTLNEAPKVKFLSSEALGKIYDDQGALPGCVGSLMTAADARALAEQLLKLAETTSEAEGSAVTSTTSAGLV
jgi:hypothetical protein